MDLPEWERGNPLGLVITGTGKRVAESFGGGAAPVLVVRYVIDPIWFSGGGEGARLPGSDPGEPSCQRPRYCPTSRTARSISRTTAIPAASR